MNYTPNVERQRMLNVNNFKNKQELLFCPDCIWQASEPLGMKPWCPECGAALHVTRVSDELRELITDGVELNFTDLPEWLRGTNE